MPRANKGPRLYFRPPRPDRPGVWVIRDDGGFERSTGFGKEHRAKAEKELKDYLAEKGRTPSDVRGPDRLMIADTLTIYAQEHAINTPSAETAGYNIDALVSFWGAMTVDKIIEAECRRYVNKRTEAVASDTARRELETLRAALNHCQNKNYLSKAPRVWLPEKAPPREYWATPDEVARFLRHARRIEHLKRFTLLCLYTGTRSERVRRLRWAPSENPDDDNGYIDIENGLIYREPPGKKRTNKRAPPVRILPKLRPFLERWRATSRQWVVEYNGKPVSSLKTSWSKARRAANLPPEFRIHGLRHTGITWAMQGGARLSDIAGYFGITIAELERTYAHHHPDHTQTAMDALQRRRK